MSSLQFMWLKKGDRHADVSPLLEIQSLTVRVGIRRILNDINLNVYPGDHIRITGPNGSGKSTLLNAIAGVEPARLEQGKITFGGRDISSLSPHERAALGIVYMRQMDNVFPALTVAENLKLALGEDGPDRFQDAYPEWAEDLVLEKPVGQLSGGQKQKLAWVMTILGNHRVLLVDEPESGMSQHVCFSEQDTYLLVTHEGS